MIPLSLPEEPVSNNNELLNYNVPLEITSKG